MSTTIVCISCHKVLVVHGVKSEDMYRGGIDYYCKPCWDEKIKTEKEEELRKIKEEIGR